MARDTRGSLISWHAVSRDSTIQVREITLLLVRVRGRQAAPEIYVSHAVPGYAGHRMRKSPVILSEGHCQSEGSRAVIGKERAKLTPSMEDEIDMGSA